MVNFDQTLWAQAKAAIFSPTQQTKNAAQLDKATRRFHEGRD
jgi:hypothetical protein